MSNDIEVIMRENTHTNTKTTTRTYLADADTKDMTFLCKATAADCIAIYTHTVGQTEYTDEC